MRKPKKKKASQSHVIFSPQVENIIATSAELAAQTYDTKINREHLTRAIIYNNYRIISDVAMSVGVSPQNLCQEFLGAFTKEFVIEAFKDENRIAEYNKNLEVLGKAREEGDAAGLIGIFHENMLETLSMAQEWSEMFENDGGICTHHILLALCEQDDSLISRAFKKLGVGVDQIMDSVSSEYDWRRPAEDRENDSILKIEKIVKGVGVNSATTKEKEVKKAPKPKASVSTEGIDILSRLNAEELKTFELLCVDMTPLCKQFNPIVGRDKDVERIMEVLLRKGKCAPIIVGPAGCGKTSAVELLGQKILKGEVHKTLLNKSIFQLNVVDLLSGTIYRGALEERVKNLISAMRKIGKDAIFFMDEIHTLSESGKTIDGSSSDLANMFKPLLADTVNPICLIGATTNTEFKIIEKDAALARRFSKVEVAEPDKEASIEIIKAILPHYAKYHELTFEKGMEEYIYDMAKSLKGKTMPDSAVDICDLALAKCKIKGVEHLDRAIIEATTNDIAGRIEKKKMGF